MAWSNWINVPDVSGVTAGSGDVLSGKVIVDKNGNSLTGTITNRTNNTGTTGLAWAGNSSGSPNGGDNCEIAGNQLRIPIPSGYYGGNTYSNWSCSGLIINNFQTKMGITADKILNGSSICGVNGTGGYRRTNQAYSMNSSSLIYGEKWTVSSHNSIPANSYASITVCPNLGSSIKTFIMNLPLQEVRIGSASGTKIFTTHDHLFLVNEGSAYDWNYIYYNGKQYAHYRLHSDGTNCWFQFYNDYSSTLYINWTSGRNLYLACIY